MSKISLIEKYNNLSELVVQFDYCCRLDFTGNIFNSGADYFTRKREFYDNKIYKRDL